MAGQKRLPSNKNIDSTIIIEDFKLSIEEVAIKITYQIDVWEGYDGKNSTHVYHICYEIDPLCVPRHFTKTMEKSKEQIKYQYSIYDDQGKRIRPQAWRIPFLEHPKFSDTEYTVSHLCHNKKCYNWSHHVLETLSQNKARNGCPGGNHCHHNIKCIRPGPYFNF